MKLTDLAPSSVRQSATSRPLVLAATFFAMGAVMTGAWFHYQKNKAGPTNDELSGQTRNSLEHLAAPVTIHYYSLLPAGGTSDELLSFSGRVNNLLEAMQEASGGKIQLTRFETLADTNFAAASADGIQAFNLDKGDAAFLGLAISSSGHKEAIARLQPEWESALQYDLVRAILRATAAQNQAPLPKEVAKPSPEIVSSINRLIPDVTSVSAQDADQIFHAEFMKDCTQLGKEMEAQINVAQEQVAQADAHGSPEDLASAQKHLLEVELQQGERMKQIAADLQTRMAVFQQMKAASASTK